MAVVARPAVAARCRAASPPASSRCAPTATARIAGYDGLERDPAARSASGSSTATSRPPGTPTQPVEAGYMANAWIRMKHPDYDELRAHARRRRPDGEGRARSVIAERRAQRSSLLGPQRLRRRRSARRCATLGVAAAAIAHRHRRLAGARGRRRASSSRAPRSAAPSTSGSTRAAPTVFARDPELAPRPPRAAGSGCATCRTSTELRLDHAMDAAARARCAHGDRELLDRGRGASVDRGRARTSTREHLERCNARCDAEFDARWRPAERDAVARAPRRARARMLARRERARDRRRPRRRRCSTACACSTSATSSPASRVVAWSAGAMVLTERVVLFHDDPPHGAGIAEVLDVGLGLVPRRGRAARTRAAGSRLDDARRVSAASPAASRPATCLAHGRRRAHCSIAAPTARARRPRSAPTAPSPSRRLASGTLPRAVEQPRHERRRRDDQRPRVAIDAARAPAPRTRDGASTRSSRPHAFPLVEGRDVTFVYRGEADAVHLRHWVFGLPSSQPLARVDGTDLWYLTLELPRGSRVEYKLEVVRGGHGEWIEDPLNPQPRARPVRRQLGRATARATRCPSWTQRRPGGAHRHARASIALAAAALGATRHVDALPAGALPPHAPLPAAGRPRRRRLPALRRLQTVLDNLIHRLEIADDDRGASRSSARPAARVRRRRAPRALPRPRSWCRDLERALPARRPRRRRAA